MDVLAQTALKCPECKSEKYFRDGKRNLSNGETTQRYVCRVCSYRYTLHTSLNAVSDNSEGSQIGAKKAKNLEPAQEYKFSAGDANLSAENKGLLAQFYSYLEKEAYTELTLYPKQIKQLARLGANLRDPENVKTIVARMTFIDRNGETKKLKNGTKMLYCYAYNALMSMLKIKWEMPHYIQEEIDPYIPDESELDALINAAKSRRMAAYLQTLKETFADPTEALRIHWIDINEKENTIKINYPVKNHNTGTMEVSNKLLSMLSALPKTHEKVFPTSYESVANAFRMLKKRLAETQKNPRILAVELRGFRHWGGTQIAYYTNGNVLTVKKLLRHKAIKSTMKYIGKINFKTDQFETTAVTTKEEILALGSTGWAKYDEVIINGQIFHCYKKPKRFSSLQGGT
jgi:integrase